MKRESSMNQEKKSGLQALYDVGTTFLKIQDRAIHLVLAFGMAIILFAVVFHVFGRYFFGKTYMGTMELVRYTMIWVSMLGTAAAFGVKEHPCIAFFEERLSPRAWFPFHLFGYLMLCVFLVVMIIGGVQISLKNWHQTSLGLQIPMLFPYLAIPVGGIAMLPYIVMDMLYAALNFQKQKEAGL